MCGIAGALVYDPAIARLECLLAAIDASAARGQDAFGVVRWSPSTGFRKYGRHVCGPHGWLEQLGQPESGELTAYLHVSRAEPTTEWRPDKTDADIPPFVDEGVAVAHNGIISNDEELIRHHDLHAISRIDTAIVPSLVARLGIWEAVAALKGGSALAILDSRQQTLALCRNFLPLVLTWEPGIVCFASEASFFPEAQRAFRRYQRWHLPPFSAIEISAQGFRGPMECDYGRPAPAENNAWCSFPELRRSNHG
jgi:glucosamine 6-phosphate synthetase-like amidotransferase/phosphosugar isomerase protein